VVGDHTVDSPDVFSCHFQKNSGQVSDGSWAGYSLVGKLKGNGGSPMAAAPWPSAVMACRCMSMIGSGTHRTLSGYLG
jgi:hypothetical protein